MSEKVFMPAKLPEVSDGTDLYDWLEFIKANNEEELKVLANKAPQMKDPIDRLLELNQDSNARTLYDAREKQRRDIRSRERKAKREGGQEKAIDIAKKMLEANLPIEQISLITGLTIKEIKRL